MRAFVAWTLIVLFVVVSPMGTMAQNGNGNVNLTVAAKANYELASRWTQAKVGKLVFDTSVTPHWLEFSDRFWYSYETNQGKTYFLADPARKSKAPIFDNAKMAAMLSTLTHMPYDAQHLPIKELKFIKKDTAIQFGLDVPKDAVIPNAKPEEKKDGEAPNARTKTLYFEYDLATAKATLLDGFEPPKKPRWASVSPDEKSIIFARGYNLYMMDAANYEKARKKADDATIVETQLTTDGIEDYSYARRLNDEDKRDLKITERDLNDQQRLSKFRIPSIQVYWSKDSSRVTMVRQDQRKVTELFVINNLANPRPTLETYPYTMPGEENAPQPELSVITLETKGKVVIKADRFKDQLLGISSEEVTNVNREKEKTEPQWLSNGSDKFYFTRFSRDRHRLDICEANAMTGEVRVLIEERLNTYIETKPLRIANNGQDLIHWSERDGWGHYYLYDGVAGKLKNQITSGEFVTDSVVGINATTRTLFITANGREKGEDPYYTHLYRVNFDGTGMRLLNPGNASHAINMSDSNKYFVDNSSRVNSAPEAVLYDEMGGKVAGMETTDVTALQESGFQFPEPFQVKADDGITDLYGVMYKPFDFDPKKKYPIIAFVYPGPQTESVTKTFTPRNERIALAQVGFIVIEVGNRGGNPQRSKWYHNYGYGNLRDYGLADKKSAIEQLARRHPFIDIDKVGIYGHSGGGFMSTAAMLVYPDFFKVAVSSSGNHENNVYNRNWSETNHGVKEVTDKEGNIKFEYSIDKNSDIAKNLKGHLLLTTGDIDDNVHPANTFRLADALIKANKRFDLFVFPGKRHAYADMSEYFFWMKVDYFAKHLLGSSASSVDMLELQKEKEQGGDKKVGRPGSN